jgi:hypothetical protein
VTAAQTILYEHHACDPARDGDGGWTVIRQQGCSGSLAGCRRIPGVREVARRQILCLPRWLFSGGCSRSRLYSSLSPSGTGSPVKSSHFFLMVIHLMHSKSCQFMVRFEQRNNETIQNRQLWKCHQIRVRQWYILLVQVRVKFFVLINTPEISKPVGIETTESILRRQEICRNGGQ